MIYKWVGDFTGGNFPRGIFTGGNFLGEKFLGVIFPDVRTFRRPLRGPSGASLGRRAPGGQIN